jgi:hypothetical protein
MRQVAAAGKRVPAPPPLPAPNHHHTTPLHPLRLTRALGTASWGLSPLLWRDGGSRGRRPTPRIHSPPPILRHAIFAEALSEKASVRGPAAVYRPLESATDGGPRLTVARD